MKEALFWYRKASEKGDFSLSEHLYKDIEIMSLENNISLDEVPELKNQAATPEAYELSYFVF
jgi:TPR repeat protein